MQKEIYDYTFEKIFIKYLEKQAIKQTVHCATEAMIKIIGIQTEIISYTAL